MERLHLGGIIAKIHFTTSKFPSLLWEIYFPKDAIFYKILIMKMIIIMYEINISSYL